MFDFSWSEIMVIGVVALIAIPPKDLPRALRSAGIVMRRARALAREFHNSVDEMIREAELDEVQRSLRKATQLDIEQSIRQTIDPVPPPPPAPAPEPVVAEPVVAEPAPEPSHEPPAP